ncbi:hypothetical protein C8R43DRAFT_957974 [Mycena crocata]|nr:hypothetical protein C8R43DRAFT_957974 [Mycena crocata]
MGGATFEIFLLLSLRVDKSKNLALTAAHLNFNKVTLVPQMGSYQVISLVALFFILLGAKPMMSPSEEKPIQAKKSLFRPHSLRVGNHITNASKLTLRETLWPLFLVTILYFLWGFAYGLLDTLNKHFQSTLGITRTRSSGLQAAYFGAYPLASLGYGNWVLRHYGYRAVFILGLVLEGIGALLMWPAGLKRSFGGFCGATFIIGSGLGCLETAANPYMAVTGPPRYAELRINLAQAVQAIGTVVGPVLALFLPALFIFSYYSPAETFIAFCMIMNQYLIIHHVMSFPWVTLDPTLLTH